MSRTVTISAVFAVRDWRWLWLRKRRRRVVLAERVTGRELANGRARAAQVTVRRGKGWIEFADIAGVADVTLTREYEHPPETATADAPGIIDLDHVKDPAALRLGVTATEEQTRNAETE